MKRILIINNAAIGGGVESVMLNLVKYLVSKGEQVTVFTEFNEYDFYDVYPKQVNYIHMSVPNRNRFPKEYDAIRHKRVRKKLEKKIYTARLCARKYDVVIAIKEGDSMIWAAKMRAVKKIGWVHVDYRYLYWTKSVFGTGDAERNFMREHFDRIVCVSQAAADSVSKVIGNPGNLCVKYNPIDYKNIIAKSKETCKYEKPEGKLLFVAAGRLTEQKNFPMLADICIELNQKYDFELWIIGNGADRELLEQKIQQAGTDCIKLLGFQGNPYPIIGMADWFVSSAVWETYGLAIQEALILGVPVITTTCPAIEEVFDSRFGKLTDCNYNALMSAMEEVLSHPQLTKAYRSNIEHDYKVDWLWDRRLAEICSLWEELR